MAFQAVLEDSKANGSHLLANDRNKYKSMWIRAYSSIWMIGGFALIIYMGHLCITSMVVIIQIFMAKELFNLLRKAHEDRQLPGFRLLNWLLLTLPILSIKMFLYVEAFNYSFATYRYLILCLYIIDCQALLLHCNVICVWAYSKSAACQYCEFRQISISAC